MRSLKSGLLAIVIALLSPLAAAQELKWPDILAKAKGQTVYWNAWAGDEKTNAFIGWAGAEVNKRYGVRVQHVRLNGGSGDVGRRGKSRGTQQRRHGRPDLDQWPLVQSQYE